jgi:hypothetical protein
MLRQSILDLSNSWEKYRAGETTDKKNPTHTLVVNEIPSDIQSWVSNSSKYKFRGSDGQGNILRTPWFATLNLEITDSATEGYYLVYLISADFKTLTLAIAFGAKQFENHYGRGKAMFAALDSAVVSMRLNSEHLLGSTLKITRKRTNSSELVLNDANDFQLKAYEKCAIYSLSYDVEDLPTEDEMKLDYLEYLKLYDRMSESLLLADVDSYVYESIEEVQVVNEVSFEEFHPKIFKKRVAKKDSTSTSASYRHSKKSDKVGKLGEKIVVDFEKKKLIAAGRKDLADRVIWHRDFAENRTPGWDVTSFNKDGKSIFIEVKSSEGKTIRDVELTVKEWLEAEKCILTDDYKVYLVSDVFSRPIIQQFSNPAKMVRDGTLTLSIIRYQLLLGSYEK